MAGKRARIPAGMTKTSILWILNGCGMEAGAITGGPVRFHEISRGWQQMDAWEQTLVTTAGGEGMLRRMGCTLPMRRAWAALFARREWFRAQRFWSYVLSALHAPVVVRRLPPADLVITVSDYFCDIVPALAAQVKLGCGVIPVAAGSHGCITGSVRQPNAPATVSSTN